MEDNSIGKNIRKYRMAKELKQEDLAEKTDLTPAYIGMIERGEKVPSMETFLNIVNALEVSADMILCDLLTNSFRIKNTILDQKMQQLSTHDRNMIYDIVEAALKHL